MERWYVPINGHKRCIWRRLAAICDAGFDWGVVSPQFGEGVIEGDGHWSSE